MDDLVVLVPCTFWTICTFLAIAIAVWAIVDRIEQSEETERIKNLLKENEIDE